jgi:hypothetical protein
MEKITEKWGYKIGEKLIREYQDGKAIVSVIGFTKSYVRASDNTLFEPDGFHCARGGNSHFFKTYYKKASEEDIRILYNNMKKKKLAYKLLNLDYSILSVEDLENIWNAVPEKYKK